LWPSACGRSMFSRRCYRLVAEYRNPRPRAGFRGSTTALASSGVFRFSLISPSCRRPVQGTSQQSRSLITFCRSRPGYAARSAAVLRRFHVAQGRRDNLAASFRRVARDKWRWCAFSASICSTVATDHFKSCPDVGIGNLAPALTYFDRIMFAAAYRRI
jgi:hypothetical protein